MTQQVLQKLVGASAVAFALQASQIPQMLSRNFGGNEMLAMVLNGFLFTIGDDIYSYVSQTGEVYLLRQDMQYSRFIDKSLYMGLVSIAGNMVGIDTTISDMIGNYIPRQYAPAVTIGAFSVIGDQLRDALMASGNEMAVKIAHPLTLLGY